MLAKTGLNKATKTNKIKFKKCNYEKINLSGIIHCSSHISAG